MERYFFLLLIMVFALPLAATHEAVYISWQKDPTTTITIHQLVSGDARPHLELGNEEGSVWKSFEGSVRNISGCPEYRLFIWEIVGLSPDTNYQFSLEGVNTPYRFSTLPQTLERPVRFVSGGDLLHRDGSLFVAMSQQAAALAPDFAIVGGDIAYSTEKLGIGGDYFGRWVEFLQIWEQLMVTPEGFTIPMIPVIGNHDVVGRYHQSPASADYFYTLFTLPGPAGYNALDVGDYMSLVLLDSAHTHPVDGPQKDWLETTLAARQGISHIFAVYHVPAFPGKNNKKSHVIRDLRHHWTPLFDAYGVTAAFEHHEHVYKRTHPLFHGKPSDKGVVYIGGGAWGSAPRTPHCSDDAEYLAYTDSKNHVLLVTITDAATRYEAVDIEGHVFDTFHQPTNECLLN